MPSGKEVRETNKYMLPALEDVGLEPASVDYISALGTSIPAGDIAETLAIKHAFGDQLHQVLTGHMLGAAGGAEAVFCLTREMGVDVVLTNSFSFEGTEGTLLFGQL